MTTVTTIAAATGTCQSSDIGSRSASNVAVAAHSAQASSNDALELWI
ncbi:MAG: hypothetical protein PGN16_20045 [Sphingomonas phyllosphaerae]